MKVSKEKIMLPVILFGCLQLIEQRINQDEAEKLINDMDASELIHELTNNGMGYIFHEQFQNGMPVYTDELIKWVHAETKGSSIIVQLEMIFS